MSIVNVADVKAHSNITTEDDDALLEGKIAAAEEWIGKFIGTSLESLQPAPEPLKEATMQLVAHWYENREASIVAVTAELMPLGLYDLMAPYREYVF